jgi:hypothetical protein
MNDADTPYNSGSPSSYAYTHGYRDAEVSKERSLLVTLNRLRDRVEPGSLTAERAAFLNALDEVAEAQGLRKEIVTRYVV